MQSSTFRNEQPARTTLVALAAGVACAFMAPTLLAQQNAHMGMAEKTNHPWAYPQAASQHVDYYHGVAVADPYRWLEDPDSEQTRRWVDAQVALTNSYLQGVPQREAIESRITQLWNFEKFGTPFKQGGRYFWSYNSGLQNQGVIYTGESLGDAGRVVLDPNALKADGTMALAGMAVTDDGRLMAYGIAEAGSDWNTWKVRDVSTGQDLPDVINWVKFSGASWTNDGKGFFYSRYDAPKGGNKLVNENYYQKLYYHALGTPQSEDVLVYQETDEAKKDWGFGGSVTEDGNYLVISVWKGTDPKNRVYVKSIRPEGNTSASLGDGQVVKLLDEMDASYEYVGNDGSVFYFFTDLNAPRGRLISIDLNSPARSNWKELIAQNDATLRGVGMVGDQFFANYLRDARSEVTVHDRAGAKVRTVEFPGIGTVGGFGGKRTDTETFYAFAGFTTPTRIYRYDLASGQSTLFREAKVAFDPDAYETRQVFYTSKDGTKVPMFITHKKGLALDGSNPTLLYGYGGFNIPITPSFSITNLVWMEMGGVYASANIRGGGEYGESWHLAGTKLTKQNVFDDFIAAAEWLIASKYTRSDKLAIRGGSNGGLLVGACMTQRPELFGACLPEVGVLDMLRFHKFTIGHAWRSDYGAADGEGSTPEQFKALLAYSPLHNVKQGVCYPPTMIMTADHDDRVVPAHSYKFAAALQAAQGQTRDCSSPTLIRIETRAGHGAGKPTAKIIEEAADRWAFLVRALNMSPRLSDANEQPASITAEATPAAPASVAPVSALGHGIPGQREAALIDTNDSGTTRLALVSVKVEGMKCAMCSSKVEKAFKKLKGVKEVVVDLNAKTATVTAESGSGVDGAALVKALSETEFTVTPL